MAKKPKNVEPDDEAEVAEAAEASPEDGDDVAGGEAEDAEDADAGEVDAESAAVAETRVDAAAERGDVGPDPVIGLGVFVVGLLIMATGGAATMHWVFNVGEGLLLLGVAIFIVCVAITSHKQNPISLKESLKRLFKDDDDEGQPKPTQKAEPKQAESS